MFPKTLSGEDLKSTAMAMLAHLDGKKVQVRAEDGKWYDVSDHPKWDQGKAYRVKPVEVYRPWKEKEVPLGHVVKHKLLKNGRFMITGVDTGSVYLGGYGSIGLDELFDKFVMEKSGEPCGIKDV